MLFCGKVMLVYRGCGKEKLVFSLRIDEVRGFFILTLRDAVVMLTTHSSVRNSQNTSPLCSCAVQDEEKGEGWRTKLTYIGKHVLHT